MLIKEYNFMISLFDVIDQNDQVYFGTKARIKISKKGTLSKVLADVKMTQSLCLSENAFF